MLLIVETAGVQIYLEVPKDEELSWRGVTAEELCQRVQVVNDVTSDNGRSRQPVKPGDVRPSGSERSSVLAVEKIMCQCSSCEHVTVLAVSVLFLHHLPAARETQPQAGDGGCHPVRCISRDWRGLTVRGCFVP